jgi:GNAT superfamily N-acetyltransferase
MAQNQEIKLKLTRKYGNVDITMYKNNKEIGSALSEGSYIQYLYVKPSYRGLGYGSLLLENTENEIKNRGYKCCSLMAIPIESDPRANEYLADKEKLRTFYRNRGYINTSRWAKLLPSWMIRNNIYSKKL